jgi:signal recognition particle subunit SRP54
LFDKLTDRITGALDKLTGKSGKLPETAVDESLLEVRRALLEADVNYKVVKNFLAKVKDRISVIENIHTKNLGQHAINIVNEELTELMGSTHQELDLQGAPPCVVMMVGLQGSGKTTTAAKLALYVRNKGRRPYLVPADVARPAAVHQLTVLATEVGAPVYAPKEGENPLDIVGSALIEASNLNCDTVFVDTAGRLTIDSALMEELSAIKKRSRPREILLVADSMTGQEAVTIARDFNERLNLTGIILTKMEGDARAGAAMSMRATVGKPLKFIGTGEKLDALEPFHPERTASMILGMGDVLTLIEKTKDTLNEEQAQAYAAKFQKGMFTIGDMRDQMARMKKIGTVQNVLSMIPGLGKLKNLAASQPSEEMMKVMESMVDSMTQEEKDHAEIIDASRRRRIASGSGRTVRDVNDLLRTYTQMKQVLRKMKNANFSPSAFRQIFGS